jgi:hypothetical protein
VVCYGRGPLPALTGRYAGDRRMRRIAPFRTLPGLVEF